MRAEDIPNASASAPILGELRGHDEKLYARSVMIVVTKKVIDTTPWIAPVPVGKTPTRVRLIPVTVRGVVQIRYFQLRLLDESKIAKTNVKRPESMRPVLNT